jgi:hypothetical protein
MKISSVDWTTNFNFRFHALSFVAGAVCAVAWTNEDVSDWWAILSFVLCLDISGPTWRIEWREDEGEG